MAKSGGLEIDEDPAFQRKLWRWQRWAWGGIAAVLAFAALGGLGGGPLSWAEARDGSGRLRIAYERFGRMGAPNEVALTARPDADGRLRLRLGAGLLDDFAVKGLEDQPSEARIDDDGIVYTIDATPGARQVVLRLEVRPRAPGRGRIEVGLDGGPSPRLSQFVYP